MTDFNIKSKPAKKYFESNNSSQFQSDYNEENKETQKEKIQLDFNLINGKNNYVYALKLVNPDNSLNDSIISELLKCQNSDNLKLLSYSCEYNFGKEQILNLELMIKQDKGYKSYPISTSIGEIVGSENCTKIFDIKGIEEKLEVKGKSEGNRMKYVTIQFILEILSSTNRPLSEK